MVNRYFMVHNLTDGGPPKMTHTSVRFARQEAKRLAMAAPGKTFVILGAVDAYYMPPNYPQQVPVRTANGDFGDAAMREFDEEMNGPTSPASLGARVAANRKGY